MNEYLPSVDVNEELDVDVDVDVDVDDGDDDSNTLVWEGTNEASVSEATCD